MHGHYTSITKSRKVRCYAYKHDTINSHDVITSPCSTLTPLRFSTCFFFSSLSSSSMSAISTNRTGSSTRTDFEANPADVPMQPIW